MKPKLKLKLSDEQLRILAPVVSGLICYTGLQVCFIVGLALGRDANAAFFTLGWVGGMILIGMCDFWQRRRDSRRQMAYLQSCLDDYHKAMKPVIDRANEIISKQRVEGDEWKDADND